MPLTANVRAYMRPLDTPTTEWCDEHALPCRLVQHFAVELYLGGSDTPFSVEVLTVEGHD